MALAIDFGTSRVKIGLIRQGTFHNLVDEATSIPSVVAFHNLTGNLFFGFDATLRDDEHLVKIHYLKLALKRDPDFTLGPYNLEQLLTAFFHYIKEKYVLPQVVDYSSIISGVPNFFGLNARRLMIRALQNAFDTEDIELLPEPAAAFIGYNFSHPGRKIYGDILSIDIGGGTADFSFFTAAGDDREFILESQLQIGSDAFSGSEMDRWVLRNLLFPAYMIETGKEIPSRFMTGKQLQPRDQYSYSRMLQVAENIKMELGKQDECYIHAVDFYDSSTLRCVVQRETIIHVLQPLMQRLSGYVQTQLAERAKQLGLYGEQGWQLDHILLLGGASLSPGIKRQIEGLFPGIPVILPGEAELNTVAGLAARGSGDQKYSLMSVKSIYPFSFYLELFDPELETLFLHKLPFDTGNLELDLSCRYKIFTLDRESAAYLIADQNNLQLRIWETEVEDESILSPRFSGREVVLDRIIPLADLDSSPDIYLNLKNACLELDARPLPPREGDAVIDFFLPIKDNNLFLYRLVEENPSLFNPEFARDFSTRMEELQDSPYFYHEHGETVVFKLYTLLQLLKKP